MNSKTPTFPDRPTVAPDNPQLCDAALLTQAIECATAADAYASATRIQDWFVHYLLIGTGIECALKAFGILRGASEKDLRRWSHSLTKAHDFAERHDFALTLTASQRGALELLSELHASKATTYPLVRGRVIPNPQIVRTMLDEIIRAVFIAIWGPDRYAHDRASTLGMAIPDDAYGKAIAP